VENTLINAARRQDRALMFVTGGGEGNGARKTRAIKDQRGGRKSGSVDDVFEIIENEVLDALIDGAEMTGERSILFPA
jgi:hypothetical protein